LRLRQKYFLVVSAGFIILGLIILARAAIAGVPIIGILGAVLIALGLVRIRDFFNAGRRGPHDS
jgi:uncharacterized membrane protein HdeD (DUF308 family)